jgi:acyl-CoA thioester hydrolase
MVRTDFRHLTPVTIHWGDMDALGHVNNVIFFRYVESGRISYFNELAGNDPSIWGGQGPILADIQCTFLDQLHYPAEIEVATRTARLGAKSMTIEAALFRKDSDEVVATSRAVVVWFDYEQQATVRISEAMRERIQSFEAVSPVE